MVKVRAFKRSDWSISDLRFVRKDMNEFTKSILPRMFKHSNFASFVRQLNKYDFHKVSCQPVIHAPCFLYVGANSFLRSKTPTMANLVNKYVQLMSDL